MTSKPVVEVKPESLVENREPRLIEVLYGLPEKETSYTKLPLPFTAKEGFVLYTYAGLTLLIYTYDQARGVIVVRDMFKPLPFGSYEINAIGGERIKKTAEVGVIYVNTTQYPILRSVRDLFLGLSRDLYRVSLGVELLRVMVLDPVKLVTELWRRYYAISENVVRDLVSEIIVHNLRYIIAEKNLDDIVFGIGELESFLHNLLRKELNELGIDVVKLVLSSRIAEEDFERYFWHTKQGIPLEYMYLTKLLNRLPKNVIEKVPEIPMAITLALVGCRSEELSELLRHYYASKNIELAKKLLKEETEESVES